MAVVIFMSKENFSIASNSKGGDKYFFGLIIPSALFIYSINIFLDGSATFPHRSGHSTISGIASLYYAITIFSISLFIFTHHFIHGNEKFWNIAPLIKIICLISFILFLILTVIKAFF
jgi:hypothetical protein